jgi:hypothetical protein
MGKPTKIALVLLLLVLIGSLIRTVTREREPAYRGESLSYWLQEYNRAQSSATFAPIDEAIQAMGTNALPHLLSDLAHRDSSFSRQLARWYARHRWFNLPFYGEDRFMAPAMMALRALGPEANPILPGLQNLMERNDALEQTARVFFFVGPTAIPTLERVCHNSNRAVRIQAAITIVEIKESRLGYLGWAFSWQKSPINGKPLLHLGWGYTPNTQEQAVRQLVEGLQNPDPAIRLANIEALQSIGAPTAKSAWAGLLDLGGADPQVIKAAQEALRQVDPQATPTAGAK